MINLIMLNFKWALALVDTFDLCDGLMDSISVPWVPKIWVVT